ncbi:MAG: FkbM family methyltransferase [Candidatus Competibacter sp.]|nr:FkbM family methyltransferase [Candidatus Competibacter sp.]
MNYYQAHLDAAGVISGSLSVLAVPIDDLLGGATITLIKIDVEGHEAAALAGLQRTIRAADRQNRRPDGDCKTGCPRLPCGAAVRLAERLISAARIRKRPGVLAAGAGLPRYRSSRLAC